jgi:hypothetical protein
MTLVDLTCPAGHKSQRPLTEEELKRVSAGDFRFWCFECSGEWKASPEQRASIAKHLSDGELPLRG